MSRATRSDFVPNLSHSANCPSRGLIRFGQGGNTINYLVLSAVTLLRSIDAMQSDENPPQSLQDTKNQQPEDLIRQGYTIQASGGQTFVEPNALQGENLRLAKVLKPNLSNAVKMAVGVRVYFSRNVTV